jgi:ketosteroid isomerase-like protein
MSNMTRLVAGFSLFLLSSCIVLAQEPAPVPAPAPQSAAQPSVTSAESPAIREFQKFEDNWSEAVNQRDQYALELVLSPLFLDVSASGDITTRNQQLAQLITLEDKSLHLEQKVITVRMMGDIAVANGTYVLHRKNGSAEVDEKGVFTHVFERARGTWMCINSQRTKVPEESNPKGKKQPGSESPFHIPLFGRGDK